MTQLCESLYTTHNKKIVVVVVVDVVAHSRFSGTPQNKKKKIQEQNRKT